MGVKPAGGRAKDPVENKLSSRGSGTTMGIQLYYHGIATLPPVARNDRKEEQGIPWKINCHPEGVERPWGSRQSLF